MHKKVVLGQDLLNPETGEGSLKNLVMMTQRSHPFPCRTRKLSSAVPKILGGKPPGKIGRCRNRKQQSERAAVFLMISRREKKAIDKVAVDVVY